MGAFWRQHCVRLRVTSLDREFRILTAKISMAWLKQRFGLYRVAFRHGGRKLHYSVGSDNQKEAKACMAGPQGNLRLVERGRLEVPAGADLAVFLVTDGKLNAKPVIDQPLTLAEVFERYEAQPTSTVTACRSSGWRSAVASIRTAPPTCASLSFRAARAERLSGARTRGAGAAQGHRGSRKDPGRLGRGDPRQGTRAAADAPGAGRIPGPAGGPRRTPRSS